MIHSNEYLYGSNIEIPRFSEDVIKQRLELLKGNLESLLEHSYYLRDNERVGHILKAIKFYENFMEINKGK